MNEFLAYIKQYIADAFSTDSSFTKTVTVTDEWKQGNEITTANTPQIQIQILDNSEVERYSSFEGENVSNIPLQITVYTSQGKFLNVMKSAQQMSRIYGEKLKKVLNTLRESKVNGNIERCSITTMSPAMPLLNGEKVYATAIRCEFWVANPYVVGE